eukprot:TRINITY_DN1255_c0_g3_i2.p1 TRINITY_DN1255_c0_g3~~TRINITY_DN1255_c0_g3_i2.p1  ORF type:complete len:1138 (-),score=266.57 TRINITY_DN1255_c0_g3_i2:229-3642(-)
MPSPPSSSNSSFSTLSIEVDNQKIVNLPSGSSLTSSQSVSLAPMSAPTSVPWDKEPNFAKSQSVPSTPVNSTTAKPNFNVSSSPSSGSSTSEPTRSTRSTTVVVYGGGKSGGSGSGGDAADPSKSTVDTSNLMYFENEIICLQDILKFIVTKIPDAILLLSEKVDKTKQQELADAFVNLSFAPHVTIQLIEHLLTDEFVKNCSAGKEILRENGTIIRFLKPYLKIVGSEFLKNVLSDFVYKVCISEKKISFEIDPTRVDADAQAENQTALVESLDALIKDLSQNKRTLDVMPPGIRRLCKKVFELAEKFKPDSTYIYTGSFLMLRFINPALFSPEMFGLLPGKKPIAAIPRRNLTLITKILQNVSNNVSTNKKEPYMNSINLTEWRTLMYGWFDRIRNVNYNDRSVHEKVETPHVPVTDLHTLHSVLFEFYNDLIELPKTDAERFQLKELLTRLGSYENKKNCANLKEQHLKLVTDVVLQMAEECRFMTYMTMDRKKKNKPTETVSTEVVLVIGLYFIIIIDLNGKVRAIKHPLELKKISSTKSDYISLSFQSDSKAKTSSIRGTTPFTDQIIVCILRLLDYTFPGKPDRPDMDIEPADRKNFLVSGTATVSEPCDGIVPTYMSLCRYYKVEPVPALRFDLDKLFVSSDTINFSKFTEQYKTPLTDEQSLPLFHALGYNRHFKKLVLKNFTLKENTFQGLVELVKNTRTFTSITLSQITVTGSSKPGLSLINFFKALRENRSLLLEELDLSDTPFIPKVVDELVTYLKSILYKRASFKLLDFSGCLSSKSISSVLKALIECSGISELKVLKWNRTKFGAEVTPELAKFISLCSNLEDLELMDCNIDVSLLLQNDLIHKSCTKLTKLNISHNKLSREAQWQGIYNLFETAEFKLNISYTSIPDSVLIKILMLQVGSASIIATNNNLGFNGAKAISEVASKTTCVKKLDLSDNEFTDHGVALIVEALCNNENIEHINLNHNFQPTSEKYRTKCVDKLCLLATSICKVKVLRIRGNAQGRLKDGLNRFFYALGNNDSITKLDISGHGFGDVGAIIFSRILQQSKKLNSVRFDENMIGLIGLKNLSNAITHNSKQLKNLLLPYMDITRLLNESTRAEDKQSITKIVMQIQKDLVSDEQNVS